MTRKEPSLGDLDGLLAPSSQPKAEAPKPDAPKVARCVEPEVIANEAPQESVVAAVAPTPAATQSATPAAPPATTAHPTLCGLSGRLRRVRLINRIAFAVLIVLLIAYPVLEWIQQPRDAVFYLQGFGFAAIVLIATWFIFSSLVRRMHDIGRSAWWLVALLIPAIQVLPLLALLCLPGKLVANRFGPANPYSTMLTWLLFLLLVLLPVGLAPAGAILYDAQLQSFTR
jgi:uncharacterized membrane protein YhaH (DUF805 family)